MPAQELLAMRAPLVMRELLQAPVLMPVRPPVVTRANPPDSSMAFSAAA